MLQCDHTGSGIKKFFDNVDPIELGGVVKGSKPFFLVQCVQPTTAFGAPPGRAVK